MKRVEYESEPSVERSWLLDENDSDDAIEEQILIRKLPETARRKK